MHKKIRGYKTKKKKKNYNLAVNLPTGISLLPSGKESSMTG